MAIGGLQDPSCSAWVHLTSSEETYMSGHEGEQIAFMPVVRNSSNPYQLIWDPKLPQPAQWHSGHPPPDLKWKPVEVPRPVFWRENEHFRRLTQYSGQKYKRPNGGSLLALSPLRSGGDHHRPLRPQRYAASRFRNEKTGSVKYHFAGFGHLNAALSQLVMQSVSEVVATPIDPATYKD
jgi:hypothetical protein